MLQGYLSGYPRVGLEVWDTHFIFQLTLSFSLCNEFMNSPCKSTLQMGYHVQGRGSPHPQQSCPSAHVSLQSTRRPQVTSNCPHIYALAPTLSV